MEIELQEIRQTFPFEFSLGAFKNYVDQILPNFDTPTPRARVDKNGHFTYYLPFVTPPSSCPRSY